MPSLLEMTDVPMTNILEKCTYKSVLTLRKVCHSLRNFIDDSCFKTDLDTIHIIFGHTGVSVLSNAFCADGNGKAKNWTPNDLKMFLKIAQNSKLSGFSLNTYNDNAEELDDLEDILKNLTRPLQAKLFQMEGSKVLKILPYLDSKTLKEIFIYPAGYETDVQNLDGIEQFLELEHFKNAMKIYISSGFLVRAPLRKFFHFQEFSVNLLDTSLEELVALKEAFVCSTHMELVHLSGGELDENRLQQVFGRPFHTPCDSHWFFEIRNCKEHVLRIELMLGFGLVFRKWEVRMIPENAFVQQ